MKPLSERRRAAKAKQSDGRVAIPVAEAQARAIAGQLRAAGRAAEAASVDQALARKEQVLVHVPPEEAMRLATGLHQSGDSERAEKIYKSLLDLDPGYREARHFLGVSLHQNGRSAEGLKHIRTSLAGLGEKPWAWNNLGNVLKDMKDIDGAGEAYGKALALKPDYAEGHNNFAAVCRARKQNDLALAHFTRAIDIDPDYAEAFANRGNLHMKRKAFELALADLSRAIVLMPQVAAESRGMLARAHLYLGETDKAEAAYREWIAEEPDNPVPRHLLAACLGEAPERAADDYVAKTFDDFADDFDSKLAQLEYRAPDLVTQTLEELRGDGASFGAVADAGCGTGLCGPLLRARATQLTGVDLSPGMLAKARDRAVYDELHETELTAFFAARPAAFDVIVSADTLCYFGVLDGFAEAAAASLHPGGALVFTVEALPDDDAQPYRLQAHGRYAHRRSFVEEALAGAGFVIAAMRRDELRKEDGRPVEGFVIAAERAG